MNKLFISGVCVSILSIGLLTTAVAQTPPYTYEDGTEANSRGIVEIGNAKFDSTDLGKIYTEVNDGKTAIATQMTSTAGIVDDTLKNENGIYTFEKLVAGVDATYNNGKNAIWSDIQSAADGSQLSTGFGAVDSISSLVEAVNASNEASYNRGLAENLATSNNVIITYHTHSDACRCGSTSYREEGPSEHQYLGGGTWTTWSNRYCRRCGAFMGSYTWTEWQAGNSQTTDNRKSVCDAITCGRTEGTSIDVIKINGQTFDVLNGTITNDP